MLPILLCHNLSHNGWYQVKPLIKLKAKADAAGDKTKAEKAQNGLEKDCVASGPVVAQVSFDGGWY